MNSNRVAAYCDNALPLDTLVYAGVRGNTVDVNVLATADATGASALVWNYSDEDLPFNDVPVTVTFKNVHAKRVLLQHYRIDESHSNAYQFWKQMGLPQNVTPLQYTQLEKAGQLELLQSPSWLNVPANGNVAIKLSLPGHSVSLLKISYQQ